MRDDLSLIQQIAVLAIPVLLAVTLHEAAHGYVAYRFGDDTAKQQGRMTLNPFRHIDPVGTILLPIMLYMVTQGAALFGWAKPVPVAFHRLQPERLATILVAFAGPGANFALALLSALLLRLVPSVPSLTFEWIDTTLSMSVRLNVILAIVNLLPIPPLDGGRILMALLPARVSYAMRGFEMHGLLVVVVLLLVLPQVGPMIGVDVNIFSWLVEGPSRYVLGLIQSLTGVGVTGLDT
jgi:Zn-dependent protease